MEKIMQQILRYRHYLADNPEGYWFKKGYPWGWSPTGWGPFFISLALIVCGFAFIFSIENAVDQGGRMVRLFIGLGFFGMFYYLASTKCAPEANAARFKFWYDSKYDESKYEVNSYVRLFTSWWFIILINVVPILLGVAVGIYFSGV